MLKTKKGVHLKKVCTLFFCIYMYQNLNSMQKRNISKLLAFAMLVCACVAFAMHLCSYANFCMYADIAFRVLLLTYLLFDMKVK